MICLKCCNEKDFEIREEKETITVRGEQIEILSKVTYCKDCGEQVWNPIEDSENLKKAYDIYRKNHNLLSPTQIIKIRENYGISQTTFSKVLGLGEKTITRYENGSIQDAAQNNLIVLAKNINNFKTLYEINKYRLDKSEKEKLESIFTRFKASVIYNAEYSSPMDINECYFGGFTYEQRNAQYQFCHAV